MYVNLGRKSETLTSISNIYPIIPHALLGANTEDINVYNGYVGNGISTVYSVDSLFLFPPFAWLFRDFK